MDADRATANLVAVQHHVVTTAHRGLGVGTQIVDGIHRRRGERVMQGDVALRLVIPFEHREVGHPQRCPALADQVEVLAGFQAHRAHEIGHFAVGAGTEKHDVAVACAHVRQQRLEHAFGKEFGHRRIDPASLVDLGVGQALRAEFGGVRGVFVNLLA